MSVRKTKSIWIFKTPTAQVAYESQHDLNADLALCEQITGAKPDAEITEIPMVLTSNESAASAPRKKLEYSPAFEEFWQTHEPKQKKRAVYKEWLAQLDSNR